MASGFHSTCSNVGHGWLSFFSKQLTVDDSTDRIDENTSVIVLMGMVNAMGWKSTSFDKARLSLRYLNLKDAKVLLNLFHLCMFKLFHFHLDNRVITQCNHRQQGMLHLVNIYQLLAWYIHQSNLNLLLYQQEVQILFILEWMEHGPSIS
jgi:hypothetical protein